MTEPVSMDLGGDDCHLFRSLHNHLGNITFASQEEIETDISEFFALKPKEFYIDGIKKLCDGDVTFNDDIFNETLRLIDDKVQSLGGNKLEIYGLPAPPVRDVQHRLAQELIRETSYNMESLQAVVNEKEPILVQDQKEVYWQVLTSVDNNTGGVFFLDAPGGTGKTLLINLLLAKVRQKKKIALAVASSGIAATLLTGGRTAHSTFKLPLNLIQNESPLCNITKNTALAILLTYAKLIVWDEATMSHKAAFEALDRTLQDFRNNKKIMGGVTLLMAGDFRQTLPVVPRGTRADELRACIKSSYIWQHVKQLTLTTNMRVHIHGDPLAAQFSNKLLDIGNGKLPQDPEDNLHHLPCGNMTASLEELKSKVFPNIATNYKSHKWLRERTILAPRNDSVDKLNLNLLTQLPGPECSYRSINSVPDQQQATHYPVEFLNSLQPSGFPPHILIVKIGAPIMLLRNLDVPTLCNGTSSFNSFIYSKFRPSIAACHPYFVLHNDRIRQSDCSSPHYP
ncbi:ATP-dependent DNA helicase pif1 [Octopus bimaculoides]|uniref:ATP-dependent DNA helicase pif1 n=1 Tax=Octopus bimaculoides TaxID=37653 RepID=UPI00071E21B0|nr:ATP-dependent DNA helicase pif1 [Octopus bimaculoides]|eukprot:XP_014786386.1 PREDICTED: ATP-dependent DNA helicase pif1-like [Octopus bimaculoides]